jgi:hypothetical protein
MLEPEKTAVIAVDEHPSHFCPVCGARLQPMHCEMVCPNRACGFFMSCSEFE